MYIIDYRIDYQMDGLANLELTFSVSHQNIKTLDEMQETLDTLTSLPKGADRKIIMESLAETHPELFL
jgi:hypothetical protein